MAYHLTTILLLAAVPALWLHRCLALGLLAAAAVAALLVGRLEVVGALALLGFAALSQLLGRSPKGWAGWAAWAAVLGSAALLKLHVAPGFPAWTVMGPVRIGEGTPYEKLLAFDKTGAGILLLALAVPGILGRSGWRPLLRRAAPILGLTPLLLSLIVVASGYADWDVTVTPAFLWWGILNLLTTCVSEEALFRGLLQTRLVDAAAQHGLPAYPAILLTALIFGLSHVAGGPELVLLATLAGVGYGYAYHATRRIEAAILCHFIVNAGHFLLFT
jgi:membrane protease YdiL (CAAX protease family)